MLPRYSNLFLPPALLCLWLIFPLAGHGQQNGTLLDRLKQGGKELWDEAASKWVAKKLMLDPMQSVSRGNRKLDKNARRQAAEAHKLFDSQLTLRQAAQQTAVIESAKALARPYPNITNAELAAIEQGFRPLLDQLEYAVLRAEQPDHIMIVPPGGKRSVAYQGYCLDKGIAAPRTGEEFQLRPVAALLPDHAMPFYHGLIRYGQTSGDARQIQGLVWRLVHGIKPEKEPAPLTEAQMTVLNQATPGGAAGFSDYLEARHLDTQYGLKSLYQKYSRQEVQKLLDRYVNSTVDLDIDLYRQDLNDPVDIEEHLQRLANTAPQGGRDYKDAGYSLLADGVAAHAYSTGGVREMTVEIVNRSDQCYVYDPTEYMGFSTRRTQPVGHFPRSSLDADNEINQETLVSSVEEVLRFFDENPELLEYAGYALDGFLIASGVGIPATILRRSAVAIAKNPRKLKELWDAARKVFGELGKKSKIKPRNPLAGGKSYKSFAAFKAEYGAAGPGRAWHHIVEQGGKNVQRFGADKIHNTKNIINIPHGGGTLHAKVSGYYNSKPKFTGGLRVRDWLRTKSFEEQYEFGIDVLKRYGWKP